MRNKIIPCSIATLALLLIIGWILIDGNKDEQDVSYIDKIGEATCAKFEYIGSEGNELFITSEIKTLSNVFSSLDIMRSDGNITVSEWIFKITFNCKEISANTQEIVVLVGKSAMSINGETYCTPEAVPFESIVDLFASKYKYFEASMKDC